jgi:glycerophosphoryl diester phosphodiesterase
MKFQTSNSIFIVLSAISLLAGLYFYKKTTLPKVAMRIFLVIAFSSMLLFTTYGLIDLTRNNIDEAATYHLDNRLNKTDYNGFMAYRVAHAGGGINRKTYTNSFEALDTNIKKGFKYFEIDFSFTKDGKLVCLHDWKHDFKRSFGFEVNEKLTLKEFNYLVKNKSDFMKCTADSLADWMKANSSAYIVTDVKGNNIKALNIIIKTLPNAKARVIPQVYDPSNLETIKDMGFKKIIWTLYRYRGSNDDVMRWVTNIDIPIAVTMPKSRADSTLPKKLKERNIPTYVHTINSTKDAEKYIKQLGITEIYTDFLQP